jgi:putative selenium metabolism protein SsnA
MTATHILQGGTVLTGGRGGRILFDGAVVWQGDRVAAVGPATDLRAAYPGARALNAHGGLIMPGFIDLHTHFYSALACGLDPGAPVRDFNEVLSRLWWRFDRALDPETVRLSALLGAARCVRNGITTVFDHHASPSFITGSLDLVAGAVVETGLSAVLCYEVTDRNGHDGALAGIDENLRFIESHVTDGRVRGLMGLHASFTLCTATLNEVARRVPAGVGCHLHVAEDMLDLRHSIGAFGADPVARLESAGLLGERAVLAHGVHLDRDHLERIAAHGSVLVHNPESNMNNGVGRLDLIRARNAGVTLGLGSDGLGSSMLRLARSAFLHVRADTRDPGAGFDVLPEMLLDTNARVAGRFFDEPDLGRLVPGAPADIAVVDAPPPAPIEAADQFAHLVYGASDAPIRHTVARGRVLMEDFSLTRLDLERVAAQARAAAPALWERFRAIGLETALPREADAAPDKGVPRDAGASRRDRPRRDER